ncbi:MULTISPECIES: helicase [Francisella]|uniref:Helicase n=1 Tax=Francisella adeliensis TaxID=2007306 RepID=A0A2Z4Y039_9GAMM|nr:MULTISPECIES: helicase [Francisella]AXA34410.1 helicase [Francisella adeliensis]MBK2086502.1 helicase [Francisella adeliensis]MBK2096130.1 helicase [Francisella adeliensis]QIW12656.1 helicase [Francisella adeliensis]QIW14531.1 helicase [Francisella adeliensis]
MKYQYHHIGIPITEPRDGERYSPTMDMYTSGGEKPGRVQYHRFGPNCPLDKLIQTMPHIAYKVANLCDAVKGKNILLEPYFPMRDFKVAIIEENGAIIELIETSLDEEQIWDDSKHQDSILYTN